MALERFGVIWAIIAQVEQLKAVLFGAWTKSGVVGGGRKATSDAEEVLPDLGLL
ncbi:MAG TPA: hypothetical protein VGG18_02630 [Granulicella sp.]